MMPSSAFSDKQVEPDDQKLAPVLGKSWPLWAEIKDHVQAVCGQVVEEWKYYGAKYGWTLKTLYKKRNLFCFTPHRASFNVSFVFGDKAVAMIEKSDLPRALVEDIAGAKKYAEGRGLRIEVKTRRDVEHVKKLLAVKVAA